MQNLSRVDLILVHVVHGSKHDQARIGQQQANEELRVRKGVAVRHHAIEGLIEHKGLFVRQHRKQVCHVLKGTNDGDTHLKVRTKKQ